MYKLRFSSLLLNHTGVNLTMFVSFSLLPFLKNRKIHHFHVFHTIIIFLLSIEEEIPVICVS